MHIDILASVKRFILYGQSVCGDGKWKEMA